MEEAATRFLSASDELSRATNTKAKPHWGHGWCHEQVITNITQNYQLFGKKM